MAGAIIALGHGVIEFPLMFLTYLGFAEIFALTEVQKTVSLTGGLILIYMAIQTFKTQHRTVEEDYRDSAHGPFIAGVLATSANPYFFLWWATIGLALITNASAFGLFGFLIFAITHWSCDLLWGITVSLTVFKSRLFWTKRANQIIFAFCFLILIGFGTWFTISGLLYLVETMLPH
jgi:threonine/homoserine/homoserine lactone efflux protein